MVESACASVVSAGRMRIRLGWRVVQRPVERRLEQCAEGLLLALTLSRVPPSPLADGIAESDTAQRLNNSDVDVKNLVSLKNDSFAIFYQFKAEMFYPMQLPKKRWMLTDETKC